MIMRIKLTLLTIPLACTVLWNPAVHAIPVDCIGIIPLEDRVECAIEKALEYLAGQQDEDGHFIETLPFFLNQNHDEEYHRIAGAGLACLKFLDRARELGVDPFDLNEYHYADELSKAIEYIASFIIDGDAGELTISNYLRTYMNGVASMCFSSTDAPDRTVSTNVGEKTYYEIILGLVNWLNNNQRRTNSCDHGGWAYNEIENYTIWADNSNSGYATMGLGFAAAAPPFGFNIPIPDETLNALDTFINNIQKNDGDFDGGSMYGYAGACSATNWINTLKTGNLLYELGMVGATNDDDRVKRAVDFIVRQWAEEASGGNFGETEGSGWRKDYQAMFTMMKGLESLQIDILSRDGGDIDWYDEVATYIVELQEDDGSWVPGYRRGGRILNTLWAILTLEKTVNIFEDEITKIPFDIKPTSCRNPLNVCSRGILPAAILGTEEFDATKIDPMSLKLFRKDTKDTRCPKDVAPEMWGIEDVATPFKPYTGKQDAWDCSDEGKDGFDDLTLKFNKRKVVEMLGDVQDNDVLVLQIEGNLKEEDGSEPFLGEDVVVINKKRGCRRAKNKKKGGTKRLRKRNRKNKDKK